MLSLIQPWILYSQNANLSLHDLSLQKYQWPFQELLHSPSHAVIKIVMHSARLAKLERSALLPWFALPWDWVVMGSIKEQDLKSLRFIEDWQALT